MKSVKMFTLAITVAAVSVASSAEAGSKSRARLNDENYKYYYSEGATTAQADTTHMHSPFEPHRKHRVAARNEAYFDNVATQGQIAGFDKQNGVSSYPFSKSVLSPERGGYVWSSDAK